MSKEAECTLDNVTIPKESADIIAKNQKLLEEVVGPAIKKADEVKSMAALEKVMCEITDDLLEKIEDSVPAEEKDLMNAFLIMSLSIQYFKTTAHVHDKK